MLKLTGCILLISACSGAGFSAAGRLIKRAYELEILLNLLQQIGIYLTSDFLSTDEILARLDKEKFGVIINFNKSITDESFVSADSSIPDNIKTKLKEYFREFGSTDLKGQSAKTDLLICEVQEVLTEEKERCSRHCKLYRALGFLSGAFLAVMLI